MKLFLTTLIKSHVIFKALNTIVTVYNWNV